MRLHSIVTAPAPSSIPSRRRPHGALPRTLLALAVVGLLAAAGCGKDEAAAGAAGGPGGKPGAGGPPGGGMPPMPVGFITVQQGPAAITTELPGRLEARRQAQVRARVVGIVQKRLFAEGSIVKAGQPLYALDSDASRAALASAQAQSARAAAAVAQAQAQVERNRPLAEARAISQQEWLATQTALRQAQADAAATKAAIAAAQVPVGQATVTAPIGGRIGRSNVSEGALVGPTDPTPLAVVQQTDMLYVNFTQAASDVIRLRRAVESGRLKAAGAGAAEVQVVLEDGSVYPSPARLLFSDPTVDPTSGQLTLRAEVPNPRGLLLPGLFVRVRYTEAVTEQAMRVPQQAVSRGSAGDTVYVLDKDNKPQPRPVTLGSASHSDWIVLAGLAPGDRVVVDGFQKMQMARGAPVMPVPWTPPSSASAPASGPAQAPAPASAASAAASR